MIGNTLCATTLLRGRGTEKQRRTFSLRSLHGFALRRISANADFHGEKRSNENHRSKTDPDALLARKGKCNTAGIQLELSFYNQSLARWHR
jgi:hypothetical protein